MSATMLGSLIVHTPRDDVAEPDRRARAVAREELGGRAVGPAAAGRDQRGVVK
jgi:hypothetical protein